MTPAVAKVAKFIRENTKRPKTLPDFVPKPVPEEKRKDFTIESCSGGQGLRWKGSRKDHQYTGRCPLGMLKFATTDSPSRLKHIPVFPFSQRALTAFAKWWDSQNNAEAAIKAVWDA